MFVMMKLSLTSLTVIIIGILRRGDIHWCTFLYRESPCNYGWSEEGLETSCASRKDNDICWYSCLKINIFVPFERLLSYIYTQHKTYDWFGPELFCLLLGPPGFNCWFSSAPVFQWCCSTPQGSPGVGRNTFLSSPHLCFIIVFICDLFVSRDDPLMS